VCNTCWMYRWLPWSTATPTRIVRKSPARRSANSTTRTAIWLKPPPWDWVEIREKKSQVQVSALFQGRTQKTQILKKSATSKMCDLQKLRWLEQSALFFKSAHVNKLAFPLSSHIGALVYIYIYVYTHVNIYIHIWIHMYTHTYVYVYIHIYIYM